LKLSVLAVFSTAFGLLAMLLPLGPVTAAADAIAFTAPQVATGTKAYAQNCASCHGANLKGVTAPALVGKTSGIAQQSLVEVFEYVSQQMPMTAPGSLSEAQYLSIVAYILQKNGHKPGSRPLTESIATTSTATIVVKP
jgi:mono/diheme cytochrome c family protein